jgi:hypothetical protein
MNIGEFAFLNCTALETVTLPGVASIQQNSFSNCPALATINIKSPKASAIVFVYDGAFYHEPENWFVGVNVVYE